MANEPIKPMGMLRFGLVVSSDAVDTASKPTKAKKIEAAAPNTPVPDSGVPQPFGSIGTKFADFATPMVSAMNKVSAAIFTSTSTEVNLALLDVPATSSAVTSSETVNATRLNPPVTTEPSASV